MPKAFTSKGGRLTALRTGQHAAAPLEQLHERNVLAITRRIHTLAARERELVKLLKAVRAERRFKRRELRLALQTRATVTPEQLELAGPADGVDRAIALAENRRPDSVRLVEVLEPAEDLKGVL